MERLRSLIVAVGATRDPVLICGETGTGKSVVARETHARGPWRDRPFVTISCGALAPTLIDSELFGHVRGAFTGATQNRLGLLAYARAGTVFLDEIGDLPLGLQPKLLRALEEGYVRPIGGVEEVRLEARVLAATNEDLEGAVRRGTFRKDLYFRLNVLRIDIPPLRDRRSDIPALVEHFLRRYLPAGTGLPGISGEALSRLFDYGWPGNVRELENSVRRAVALGSRPDIQVTDLQPGLPQHGTGSPESHDVRTLRDLERRTILSVVQGVGGDRIRAAKLLGIGKTTIYRKLKEYGLEHANSRPLSV